MLSQYPFAVVDVETTGLFPGGHDRIIEIAIVRLGPTGEPESEFVTLINPERDIGPTRLHGINARDVLHAPRFSEIAGDIASLLGSAVVVCHNARFDSDFIDAEFGRVAERHPPLATICTMTLARRMDGTPPSYRLEALCDHLGLPTLEAHTALGDARATARLFGVLLRRAVDSGITTLEGLGCSSQPASTDAWPLLSRGGAVLTRQHVHERPEPSYLARLVSRLQSEPVHRDADTLEYIDLLDRVLEDRVVTQDEAEYLFQTANRWGISRDSIVSIHRDYVAALVNAAVADGIVTSTERQDLELVGNLFGYDVTALDEMLVTAPSGEHPAQEPRRGGTRESFGGLSVCFTGDSQLQFRGEHLTRGVAEELAVSAGFVVQGAVTKKLNLLVVVDAHSLSGKAVKARRFGTRIVAERVFWQMLGVPMD